MPEYRKVGRGGAGNYYSKQDIEAASKQAAPVRTTTYSRTESLALLQQRDLEAQVTSNTTQVDRNDALHPKYVTSGRGGAGNLTDASNLAAATTDHVGSNSTMTEQNHPSAHYIGRGGAGNFKDNNVIEGVAPQ